MDWLNVLTWHSYNNNNDLIGEYESNIPITLLIQAKFNKLF